MTSDQRVWLIGGIILAVIFAIFIPLIVRDVKKNKDKYVIDKEKMRAEEERRLNEEADVTSFHAEVIDMACGVHMKGTQAYRQPKTIKEFCIKFRDDGGEVYDIFVSESIYDGFEKGQRGTLTLIDGHIDSFVIDEE